MSMAASVKHTGIPGGRKRVGDLFQQADDQAKDDASPYNTEYDHELANSNKAYGDEAAAAVDEASVAKQHYAAEAALYHRQSDFYETQSKLEQKAAENAKADQAQYLGAYKEQLAGVRELMQRSGDPLGNAAFGTKAGLGFASFAQGFLAARGINIDVTGQIDRWVDRSIKEHQQQVENARGLAGDTLHLYEVARQTSQDDYEARQRYRGFVIEGMKGSLLENGSRFNSDVAASHAKMAVAKLEIEANTNEAAIGERRRAMTFGYDKLRIDEAGVKGKLEIDRSELALKQSELALKKETAKPPKPTGVFKIPDPGATTRDANGKIVGVKNMWTVDPNATAAEQTAATKIANDRGNEYAAIKASTGILRNLRAPAMETYSERYAPTAAKERFNEDYRAFQRQKMLTIMDARHAIAGANLTDNEKVEWDKILENDSGWQDGSNAKAVEQLEKHYRDKFVTSMNQTVGIAPLDPADQSVRSYNDTSNDTDANYDARFTRNIPTTNLITKEDAEAAQGSESRVDTAKKKDTKVGVSDSYAKFSSSYRGSVAAGGQPEWVDHLNTIAEAAVKPEDVVKRHGVDEKPEEVQRDAINSLERAAKDETIAEDRRKYAAYLLESYKKSPDEMLNSITSDFEHPKFK
jgi:hypothetical protein